MNTFIKNHIAQLLGITIGILAGFLYYHFIGCSSGSCPITSNPYLSMVYGAVLGYLFSDIFKKKEKKKDNDI